MTTGSELSQAVRASAGREETPLERDLRLVAGGVAEALQGIREIQRDVAHRLEKVGQLEQDVEQLASELARIAKERTT